MGPVVKIPVGFALALSVAAGLASLHTTGCTGNLGASSIVGLWQLGADAGGYSVAYTRVNANSSNTCP